MRYARILYSIQDGVAHISLNDPDTRNAISEEMAGEIIDALNRAANEARAVLLTGEGRGFSSGANLVDARRLLDDPMRDVGLAIENYLNPMIRAVRSLELPVVTAVQGAAAGVGASLALAGDLIVCGQSSYFVQAFRNVGLVSDGGASWLLARAVGRVRAMEMLLLGERVPAPKALEWGLINRVCEDDALRPAAMELALKLASGPRSLGMMKQISWSANDMSLEDVMSLERTSQLKAGRTDDFAEGLRAFLEKRPPQFKGN